jgi:hypothetical protein
MSLTEKPARRSRHAWLNALGGEDMPRTLELADGVYEHRKTYKHDFFAATGLYDGPSGLVILKLGRCAPLFGFSTRWIGAFLADRECELYEAAQGIPGVPTCLGRWGPTGFVHAFVHGHPLQRKERVPDAFFNQLGELIRALHERDIAYVDLEKRENILVGDDGRPWLIDFQISWRGPRAHPPCQNRYRRGLRTLSRLIPDGLNHYILSKLQKADCYHLLKHRRRHRPDTLSAEEIEASYRAGGLIRMHRRLFRPLTLMRRGALKQLTGEARSAKQDGAAFLERVESRSKIQK